MASNMRNLVLGGAAAAAAAAAGTAWYMSGLRSKTSGTKNIEVRFTAGGGAPSHTPGAASERGNAHNVEAKQANQGAAKKPFSEGIQYDKERDDAHQNTGKFYQQATQDQEKK